jgi:hypothetical protein
MAKKQYERLQGKDFADVKEKYSLDRIVITDNGHLKGYYVRQEGFYKEDTGHDRTVTHYLNDDEVKDVKNDKAKYHDLVEKGFDTMIAKIDKQLTSLEKYVSRGPRSDELKNSASERISNFKNDKENLVERKDKLLKLIDKKVDFEGKEIEKVDIEKEKTEKSGRGKKTEKVDYDFEKPQF